MIATKLRFGDANTMMAEGGIQAADKPDDSPAMEHAASRDDLLKSLWKVDSREVDTRAVDDMVKRLRKKLKDQKSTVKIETVWGYGFRLTSGGEA